MFLDKMGHRSSFASNTRWPWGAKAARMTLKLEGPVFFFFPSGYVGFCVVLISWLHMVVLSFPIIWSSPLPRGWGNFGICVRWSTSLSAFLTAHWGSLRWVQSAICNLWNGKKFSKVMGNAHHLKMVKDQVLMPGVSMICPPICRSCISAKGWCVVLCRVIRNFQIT